MVPRAKFATGHDPVIGIDGQRTLKCYLELLPTRKFGRERSPFSLLARPRHCTGLIGQLKSLPDRPIFQCKAKRFGRKWAQLKAVIVPIVSLLLPDGAIHMRNATETGNAASRSVIVVGDGVDALVGTVHHRKLVVI